MNYSKRLKLFASVLINFARQEAKIQYLKQSPVVLLLAAAAVVVVVLTATAAIEEAQIIALHKLANNQIQKRKILKLSRSFEI